jgi:hypothetical protein
MSDRWNILGCIPRVDGCIFATGRKEKTDENFPEESEQLKPVGHARTQ